MKDPNWFWLMPPILEENETLSFNFNPCSSTSTSNVMINHINKITENIKINKKNNINIKNINK